MYFILYQRVKMSVYKGNQKLEDIYIGNQKIDSIYKGSTLVYTSNKPYPSGTVVFESGTPGEYSIKLTGSQNYYIEIVGAGGGGNYYHASAGYFDYTELNGGASGGYIRGTIPIHKGTYTVIVGKGGSAVVASSSAYKGGDSSFYNQVAGGGRGAKETRVSYTESSGTYYYYYASGGVCTTTVSGLIKTDGNKGSGTSDRPASSSAKPGVSVYNNSSTGYGAGGGVNGTSPYKGYDGYVKIVAQ